MIHCTYSGVEPPGLWVLEKATIERKPSLKSSEEDADVTTTGDELEASEDASLNDAETHKVKKIPKKSVEMTVGVLGSGQLFGELSVLNPEQASPVSAITLTPVEVYSFDGEVLLSLGAKFSSSCMESLNESLALHNPPVEKITYYYQTKFAWEKRKIGLLKIWGSQKHTAQAQKNKKVEGGFKW